MRDEEIRHKLELLIEAESDPKERARLLIMLQISDILIDNVRAVRGMSDELHSHRTEFSAHIKRELALVNQGKGIWRVLAIVLGIAQAIIGYAFVIHTGDMREMKAAVVQSEKRLDVIEDRLQR